MMPKGARTSGAKARGGLSLWPRKPALLSSSMVSGIDWFPLSLSPTSPLSTWTALRMKVLGNPSYAAVRRGAPTRSHPRAVWYVLLHPRQGQKWYRAWSVGLMPHLAPSSHGATFVQSPFPGGIPEEGTVCPAQPLGALIHVLLVKRVPASMWTELRKPGVSKDMSPQSSGPLYLKSTP